MENKCGRFGVEKPFVVGSSSILTAFHDLALVEEMLSMTLTSVNQSLFTFLYKARNLVDWKELYRLPYALHVATSSFCRLESLHGYPAI